MIPFFSLSLSELIGGKGPFVKKFLDKDFTEPSV
jgi:hypothetical protein